MSLSEMIYRRKSTRSFTGVSVDDATVHRISEFFAELKPLYPEIQVRGEIVDREQVRCFLPWTTPQLVAIFSEEKDGYLENVGFMFQQLDLYMQSLGLGVCWLGMGRLDSKGIVEERSTDNLKFVILLAFGHPKGEATRQSIAEFKRKKLIEIADKVDENLEPARLAPSSVNSQPWYFTHEGDTIHTYCIRGGLFRKALGDMNLVDMGICLSHMYLSNPDTFRFFKVEEVGV